MSMFARIDPWVVALALAAMMLVGWRVGWWIGRRNPADPDEKSSSRFIDGSLAFFGLLLGFTFAMALSKHDNRRLLIVADSNSIGDFYTCASLLKEPHRTQLQGTIRQYVSLRVNQFRKPDYAGVEAFLAETGRLQDQMTVAVADAVNAGTPVTVPLVNTLNNLTSSHASLLAAMRDRLQVEVVLLLFAAAVISTVLVGRYHGATHTLRIAGTICYIILISLAVCVILDLNRPFEGMMRVSYESLERLAASITK